MIVLGFDFGMKYIGIAVGQSITHTATPLTALLATDGVPHWTEIQTLITTWNPEALVLGIPLNMDGSEQLLTFAARKFGQKLKIRFKLPLFTVDERLSTWEAKKRLNEQTPLIKRKKSAQDNFKLLNATAAAILVEQWLSENSGR